MPIKFELFSFIVLIGCIVFLVNKLWNYKEDKFNEVDDDDDPDFAEWVSDHDMMTDSIHLVPGCTICGDPVSLHDGRCLNCGTKHRFDEKMKEYADRMNEVEIKTTECVICGKNTMKTVYRPNPVTGEFRPAFGHCSNCGSKMMV